MADTNPITLPMVRIVKRCQGLTVTQKWIWMDLYPYFRQGCWQTAAEQGLAIGLGEDVVDRTRRVLEQVGLARRGIRAGRGQMGRPGHTWFAAFPDITPGLGRKISDEDVVRLAMALDRHIEDRLSAPDTRTGIRLSQRKPRAVSPPTDPPPEAGQSRSSAGGASSRGEGGGGMGLSFPLQGECPCSSNLPEEGQSLSETKEGQNCVEPRDSLEPTPVGPEHEPLKRFTRILGNQAGPSRTPPADLQDQLDGFLQRMRAAS